MTLLTGLLFTGLLSNGLLFSAFNANRAFEDIEALQPDPSARGAVYQWQSRDGLSYHYRIPESYDPEKGANLTLILHGSNLDQRWGFANHSFETFRPDDIVVSPNGTTPNGRGGFNFLGDAKNAKRLHDLQLELEEMLRIQGTFLYGHSQGSFFALYYAGEYPDQVDGVVAHASGVWTWTSQSRKGHDQAIVFMHGTRDPVVPYANSVGGFESYRKAKYPMIRLRSLEGWNHWPAEHNGPVPHTSQQLAWCEGMTTDDPDRLQACFEFLADVKEEKSHDYAALYDVSERVISFEGMPKRIESRARGAIAAVERLAESHVKAIDMKKTAAGPGASSRHLMMFSRTFKGVPSCDELVSDLEKTLGSHRKAGISHLKRYFAAKGKDDFGDAFTAGVAALKSGFLHHQCEDLELWKQLSEWHAEARKLGIAKRAIREFESLGDLSAVFKKGAEAFYKLNTKVKKF